MGWVDAHKPLPLEYRVIFLTFSTDPSILNRYVHARALVPNPARDLLLYETQILRASVHFGGDAWQNNYDAFRPDAAVRGPLGLIICPYYNLAVSLVFLSCANRQLQHHVLPESPSFPFMQLWSLP